jgi:hypothetical protein
VSARSDLNVDNAMPAYDAAGYGTTGDTHVSAAALGDALGRATDVRLATASLEGETPDVVFQYNAAVVKSKGRDARLTVDSLHDIRMNNGSSITSHRRRAACRLRRQCGQRRARRQHPAERRHHCHQRRQHPLLRPGQRRRGLCHGRRHQARRHLLQRAGRHHAERQFAVDLRNSLGGACGGAGAITLRGQGVSQDTGADPNYRISSDGVVVLGSTLTTGAGNIAIDGKGGIARQRRAVRQHRLQRHHAAHEPPAT